MNEPRIGGPSMEHRPVCGFALTETSPPCTSDATVHLMMEAASWPPIGLASCDDHLPVARASGTVLGEHPYDPGLCGMPGTVWRWQDVLSWCDLAIDQYDGAAPT